MIEIQLNGEVREFPAHLTVADLLNRLDLTRKRVAVEKNGAIVPGSQHGQTPVDAGDRIEIVQAIGGG